MAVSNIFTTLHQLKSGPWGYRRYGETWLVTQTATRKPVAAVWSEAEALFLVDARNNLDAITGGLEDTEYVEDLERDVSALNDELEASYKQQHDLRSLITQLKKQIKEMS